MPCSVNLYGVPANGRTGFDIRTVSIISRTVRVQIKNSNEVAIGFYNPIALYQARFSMNNRHAFKSKVSKATSQQLLKKSIVTFPVFSNDTCLQTLKGTGFSF
jgi:hypothetical protein